jgi:hypothetical protein
MFKPLGVRQGVPQGQTESGSAVLAAICRAASAQRRCYPTGRCTCRLSVTVDCLSTLSRSRTPFGVPSSILQPILIAGSKQEKLCLAVVISRRIIILAGTDEGCTRLAGAQIADIVSKCLWHCNQQLQLQLQRCFSPVGAGQAQELAHRFRNCGIDHADNLGKRPKN